jgi:ABC-type antimicrobial peptide transport system permease subunit
LNVATLSVCILLLVLPSLAIARIKPVEAIRFD